MSYKTGDTVKLKSGGPEMSVEKPNHDKSGYWCQWFAGKKLERGNFPTNSLVPVGESD
ncbi:YodC family protein [Photobacterium damselae subsp. damselae]